MDTSADLRRLDHIVSRLTGDKSLRDEAQAIIQRLTESHRKNGTSAWWDTYGPAEPVSDTSRRIIDFVVLNGQATKAELAAALDKPEDTAYRYVSRANNQLHDNGGKASISWDGGGVARTATISVIVSASTPTQDRTKLS